MRDFLEIGATPSEEDCIQVGEENYHPKARKQCQAFINLIRRTLGEEPFGASLGIKSFPHDFGSYLEVVCYFHDDVKEAINYAFKVERETPLNWDEKALEELKGVSHV